jgi:hypothetical protein
MPLDIADFAWRGLALHTGRSKKPVLVLVADNDYPHLFRIRYPSGWTSAPANLTRAKDAAYGHGRPISAVANSPELAVALDLSHAPQGVAAALRPR